MVRVEAAVRKTRGPVQENRWEKREGKGEVR